ncbi:MAG: DUF6165 family protein [Bacteriovoracaceae bacterium]
MSKLNEGLVKVPVSLGELIDKYTILRIKSDKIADEGKRQEAIKEKDLLLNEIKTLQLSNVDGFIEDLEQVNRKLWDIEDQIREKERAKEFDSVFIELARSVYITNDQRFEVKNKINQTYGSSIKEVKSYEEY